MKVSLLVIGGLLALAPSASPQVQSAPPDAVELLRRLECGLTTVAALDLPEAFLQHVADWEIRAQFREAQRRVAADPPLSLASAPAASDPPAAPNPCVTAIRPAPSPHDLGFWSLYRFDVPSLRGFRAPLFDAAADPWPFDIMARADEATYRAAATFVAEHLARDGLARATMQVMRRFPLNWLRDDELNLTRLRAVGVPVDLLSHFHFENTPLAVSIARWHAAGADERTMEVLARSATFVFTPSCPSFKALAEDGSGPVGSLRFQLPTNAFVLGEGDGSVLDVFRQIATNDALAQREVLVSIHEDALPRLMQTMNAWEVAASGANAQRVRIVPNTANITQWAQDNAKCGRAGGAGGAGGRIVTLVPRFASKSELRTQCVPTDSFVFETLARAGVDVVQSPLLFQGGNLLPIVEPRSGKRILLIGEAEIHRNRALGLTAAQVKQAFALEFGVERVEVLPAASFHIDLDFTVRRCGDGLVACVNDDVAASRIILHEGLAALQRANLIDQATMDRASIGFERGEGLLAATMLWKRLMPLADEHGVLGERFTRPFASGPLESPAANAARFLVALDVLTAINTDPRALPTESSPDRMLRNYLMALRAQQTAQHQLAQRLEALGMRVHRVPGLSDHHVSVNYVNGLQLEDQYVMPVFAGFLAPLDAAAKDALSAAFGADVKITEIRAAAMQGHDGGLHCLIGMMPR